MSTKIFFWKLCIEKLEWDAELSDSKVTEWQNLVDVLTGDKDEVIETELHGFSDNSSLDYGVKIYSRTLHQSRLIISATLSSEILK